MKEMQTDDFDPPESNQLIVRILSSRGNNLHEVESAEPIAGDDNNTSNNPDENLYRFLVSMPTKFRKNVWVKRGDFVIVAPIDEGDKVKAEIIRILTSQHIKEFTKMGIWPTKFTTKGINNGSAYASNYSNDPSYTNDDDNDDDDNDLFVNTNRAHYEDESQLSSDDESDATDSDDSNDNSSSKYLNGFCSVNSLEFLVDFCMHYDDLFS